MLFIPADSKWKSGAIADAAIMGGRGGAIFFLGGSAGGGGLPFLVGFRGGFGLDVAMITFVEDLK